MRNCDITDDGCWRWTKRRRNGSGMVSFLVDGEFFMPSRLSWLWWVGELREGEVVVPLCGRQSCVNPFHLIQCKPGVDLWRATGSCPQGHPFSEDIVGTYGVNQSPYCLRCNNDRSKDYKRRKNLEEARKDEQTRLAG